MHGRRRLCWPFDETKPITFSLGRIPRHWRGGESRSLLIPTKSRATWRDQRWSKPEAARTARLAPNRLRKSPSEGDENGEGLRVFLGAVQLLPLGPFPM